MKALTQKEGLKKLVEQEKIIEEARNPGPTIARLKERIKQLEAEVERLRKAAKVIK